MKSRSPKSNGRQTTSPGPCTTNPPPRRATAISAVSRFSTTRGNRGQSGVPDSSRPGQPPHDPVGFPQLAPRPAPPSGPDLGPEGWSAGGSRTAPDDHACSPRLVYGCRLVRCGAIARWTRDRSPGRSRHLERVRRAQPARAGQTRPRLSHRLATASGNQCARVVTRSGMDLARPLCPEDGSGDSRRTNPYGDA
jgi:hypothetical protein